MDRGPVEKSLDRIEAALSRIERAAVRPGSADQGLEERHRKLRSAVQQSLRKLDALIADQNR